MTPEEQVDLWVAGKPTHNTEIDECCPDFSCCKPHLLQPLEVRIAFKNADQKKRYDFLMVFLGALTAGKNVYIAGKDPTAES